MRNKSYFRAKPTTEFNEFPFFHPSPFGNFILINLTLKWFGVKKTMKFWKFFGTFLSF